MRSHEYNTKQSNAIVEYLYGARDTHMTAAAIVRHFSAEAAEHIGRTTIYRHLERLTRDGVLRKYAAPGLSGACYQYAAGDCGAGIANEHYHLKCERCGTLLHLECDELPAVREHILSEHNFLLDTKRTVFYGVCNDCAAETEEENT